MWQEFSEENGGPDFGVTALNAKLLRVLMEKYPDVHTFGDYFARKQTDVHLIGLDALLFEFCGDLGLQPMPDMRSSDSIIK